jgi:hypothetical protein
MRFQIVLAAFLGIAIQMITAARKGNFKGNTQVVDIDNKADTSANALSLNVGIIGNSNAYAVGSSTNANCVEQKM